MAEPFENSKGISRISMRRRFRAYCPIGEKWYSADVSIIVKNPFMIPDYCEVDKYVDDSVDGSEITIEDAVANIYDFVNSICESHSLLGVVCNVEDAAHMPVTVEKWSE